MPRTPSPYSTRRGDTQNRRQDGEINNYTDKDRERRPFRSSPSQSLRSSERRNNTRTNRYSRRTLERSRSRSPYEGRNRYGRREGRNHDRDRDQEHAVSLPSSDRERSKSIREVSSQYSKRNDGQVLKTSDSSIRAPLPSQQSMFRREVDLIGPRTDNSEPFSGRSIAHFNDVAAAKKQRPSYSASGKLAAETNTVAGTTIVLKYNEPPEARKPSSTQRWLVYIFKGKEEIANLDISTRSCWLFGREQAVVDCVTEHSSCSKQHAAIQFRFVEKRNEYGDRLGEVKPYIIDLESANGTTVNGEPLPDRRYVELRTGDVIMFGQSSREYVLIASK